MSSNIPKQVKHAYLAALTPLFDLLGVKPNQIFAGIHIAGDAGQGSLGSISFNLVARAEGDDSERPRGQRDAPGLAAGPHEFAELAWPVRVEIV